MRVEKRITIKSESYEKDVLDYIECDICKNRYSDEEWNKVNFYDVLKTSVSMETGSEYPDGGCGKIIEFDICPNCFINKLIPFLKTLDAEPRIEEWIK